MIGVAILPVRISELRNVVDAAMHLLGEVLGLEEVRHAIERVVVHKHRAEQCLLSLDVVWSRPVLRFHPPVWRLASVSAVAIRIMSRERRILAPKVYERLRLRRPACIRRGRGLSPLRT